MTTCTDTKDATAPAAAEAGRAFVSHERDHLHFDRGARVWWRHLGDSSREKAVLDATVVNVALPSMHREPAV